MFLVFFYFLMIGWWGFVIFEFRGFISYILFCIICVIEIFFVNFLLFFSIDVFYYFWMFYALESSLLMLFIRLLRSWELKMIISFNAIILSEISHFLLYGGTSMVKTSVYFEDVISHIYFKVLHYFLVHLSQLECSFQLDFAN